MHRRIMPSRLSGIVWIAAVAATAGLTWFFLGDRSDFRGIAEDAKSIVSSESAVEILDIDVQPGQVVKPGDTLVRLRNPELSLHIAQIMHDIQNASGDASMNSAESQRRIAELRASYQTRQSQYLGEIRTLEEERTRNRRLVSGFGAMGGTSSDSDASGIQDRVKALKQQIEVEEAGMRSQIALLEGSKGDMRRLANSRNDALRAELALLHEEEKHLAILSTVDGVVDSVNFRVGEKVSPFAPIMTISGHRPTLVRGYIHERVRTDLSVGDSVEILAVGMRPAKVRGVVVGLGARILEFPQRLWKIPQFPLWGREAIVRIEPENPLLLGELVTVHRPALAKDGK